MKDNWITRDGDLLEERAGSEERRGQAAGHQDRGLLLPGGAGRRDRRHVHQHPADAPVRTSRRPSRRATAASDSGSPTSSASGSRSSTPTSHAPRDQGFKNLVWDYEHEDPQRARERRARRAEDPEGDQRLPHRRPGRHLRRFRRARRTTARRPARRGSTAASIPAPDKNLAAQQARPIRPANPARSSNWGWAWPANRRSCTTAPRPTPTGKPWSERKKWVWWDAEQKSGPATTCRTSR